MNDPSQQSIASRIFFIRGKKVILDFDMAQLYEVETKVLNQAVRRNILRFPMDFMFQITDIEYANLLSQLVIPEDEDSLRSQFVTLKNLRGKHRKYLPYAFTEQGIAMLSGVLRSEKAIKVNIAIMRAFVRMRELIEENKELKKQLELLESKYDEQFKVVFDALRELIYQKNEPREPIGFKTGK